MTRRHFTFGEIAHTRPIKKSGKTFRGLFRNSERRGKPEASNEKADSDRCRSTTESTEIRTSITEEAEQ